MKRVIIESAVLAALVFGLAACERDAFSSGRPSSTLEKGHDAAMASAQVSEWNDGGPREMAPAAPLQTPTGSGGTGGGTGGTFGSGGSGGSGATGGSGGTFGPGGSGGIGGMNTGGTLR